jgi:uncharacterized LabA/DUF88 family protein
MYNRRFMDAVRLRVINILGHGAPRSAAVQGLRYRPQDVVAFVDLQNLHHFLKENCRLPATQVHLPNLLREFALQHGLPLKEIRFFTGIHDAHREPHRHEAMVKRLRWLERNGCKVVALPLSYYADRDVPGLFRAQEKGVDVRMGSEIVMAVNDGLSRALVVTQDKDLSQAIKVAGDMAQERGAVFEAFSPELEGAQWEHNGRCGLHGIQFTSKLSFSVELARKHVRPPAADHADAAHVAEITAGA